MVRRLGVAQTLALAGTIATLQELTLKESFLIAQTIRSSRAMTKPVALWTPTGHLFGIKLEV